MKVSNFTNLEENSGFRWIQFDCSKGSEWSNVGVSLYFIFFISRCVQLSEFTAELSYLNSTAYISYLEK